MNRNKKWEERTERELESHDEERWNNNKNRQLWKRKIEEKKGKEQKYKRKSETKESGILIW